MSCFKRASPLTFRPSLRWFGPPTFPCSSDLRRSSRLRRGGRHDGLTPTSSTICFAPLMPRRTDLHRILVIGSGPIIIGQAAEFDYSGTQATKALKEEGYEVILINSNPATIMTDPEFADRT